MTFESFVNAIFSLKIINMLGFETFKHNLDVKDRLGVKDVNIDKSVNYRGDLKLVKKTSENLPSNTKIPPLAAAVVGSNNTDAPLPLNTEYYDTWTDIDAQELYLNSKPTCFLIIGKPGVGAYTLGETISKKFNCIHLCPRNVIIDEIEQKTSTGKCMDFNMRHNKVFKYDTIFPIIQEKMKSPAVQHRGYVLSGLPLVTTSWDEQCFIRSLNGEEALLEVDEIMYNVIVNLKKKKKKKVDDETGTTLSSDADVVTEEDREEEAEEEHEPEEENVEEEEPRVELPKFLLEQCSDMISRKKTYVKSKKIVLLEQFKDIMDLPLKPDIIIYITCPDGDAVYKKQNTFINYGNAATIYKSISSKAQTDLRWPIKCDLNFEHASRQDSHISNSKYYCRQPMNFKEKSVDQMCNFRNYLQSFIERELEQYKPATIIKLDGCLQVYQMMYQISERLLMLPIKPVCIPEPMYLEDPPDDMEEFWQTVQELAVIRSNNVSFNRYASPWYNRCPVELKKRLSTSGNPKFAVTFLKHVYLMATLSSMIQFCRNPRPYLKLAYLEPTCRVIVTGTKSSGKTMNSKCLEWIFDAHYIDYVTFSEEEKRKKDMSTRRKIFSDIIATVGDSRFEVWQTTELERVKNLNAWYDAILKLLKKYVPLLQKYLLYAECSCGEEEQMGEEQEQQQKQQSPLDDDFFKTFQQYREDLAIFPFINDVADIKKGIADKDILLRNAPDILNTPTAKPLVPLFDDEDVTQAINAHIATNDLQKDLEPTPEELVTELSKILENIDKKSAESTCNEQLYGKWVIDNFPSDAEFWGLLSASGYMPDYTVAFIENREIDTDLFKEYKNIENSVKNYEERFLLANDELIKIKLLKKKHSISSQLDVQIILKEHEDKVLDDIFNVGYGDAPDVDFTTEQTAFTESVEKFKENWPDIQTKIEESNKCHIVIELENKTDILTTEEMLLKLRQCYYLPCIPGEPEEIDNLEEDEDNPKDTITFNLPYFFCETNVYCPVAYYDHGVLWEGKPEYSVKYSNNLHLFSNESCLNEIFTKDVTKYQSYNKPFKHIPCLRICVMGCIGSGKTTIAKYIAKELGLIHVDFVDLVNEYLIPRHFKKIGRKHENSVANSQTEEENAVEIQMGEENIDNLEADLLSNEPEFRRILNNYFEQGTSLPSLILQKLLKRLWFKNPFSSTGFVLDGFPRMLTDFEDMTACYCIPDLIIDITSSSDVVLARVAPLMFKKWKTEITEAKHLAKMKFDKQKNDWLSFVTQQVVCKVILNEIVNSAVPTEQSLPGEETANPSPTEGNKMEADDQDADPQESDLMIIYNELVQEFPEPVDLSAWEKASEARERIEARIEGIYETDDGNIENLRESVPEQKIKLVELDNTRPLDRVLRIVSAKLASVRNRCESFLEQTFVLDSDVAESLLLEGFYFISKFNRMCPVHIFENPDTIFNPYKVMKSKGMIYTVAHRCNIYFISGKTNLEKFRFNPLKYIVSNNIVNFAPYPLRFSVIGPPKCGKSTLAMKLAKKYGLICISKGKAIRHIIENMQWTELANKMTKLLKEGKCIGTDLTIKAVQTVATDHRTVTNGCVFDGLPASAVEAMELLNIGLYPLIIFDLDADKMKILNNSQNEIYFDIIKYKPPYSRSFVDDRFISWSREYTSVRNHVKEDIQNLYVLNGNESRWQCLQDATLKIKSTSVEVYHYLNKFTSDVVQAGVMCISNAAFKNQMSSYKSLCPVCLSKNVLRHGEFPIDKKGILQYNYLYYWVCPDHMNVVLNNPEYYLIPKKKVDVPEIPAVIKTVNPSFVYENGICIVSYAENLPAQKLKTGSSKFAANFHRKTYLFCSADCLNKFLSKPQLYYNVIVFKDAKVFPELSLKKLPHIGYLEQTVGDMITEACCFVNVLRPKYPGLDIQLSALLYIALYLKTHNVRTDKRFLPNYLKSLATYEARCKLMINVGLRLRAMDNPFSRYPICHHPSQTRLSSLDGTSKSIIGGGNGDVSIVSQSVMNYDL